MQPLPRAAGFRISHPLPKPGVEKETQAGQETHRQEMPRRAVGPAMGGSWGLLGESRMSGEKDEKKSKPGGLHGAWCQVPPRTAAGGMMAGGGGWGGRWHLGLAGRLSRKRQVRDQGLRDRGQAQGARLGRLQARGDKAGADAL